MRAASTHREHELESSGLTNDGIGPASSPASDKEGALKNVVVAVIALLALGAAARADAPNTAKVKEDIAKIKALLPAGVELAGAYQLNYDPKTDKRTIDLRRGDDYVSAVHASYVFADLRRDGKIGLAVAVESPPTAASDGPEFGPRALMVFMNDGSGNLVLKTKGAAILKADEGGVFGDPFNGLSISKTGALVVSHYGGSADRWALTEDFYFIKGNFYKIGRTDTSFNDLTLIGKTVDTNLITGDQIVTLMRGEDKPDQIVRKKVPVKPLQTLSQTSVDADMEKPQD